MDWTKYILMQALFILQSYPNLYIKYRVILIQIRDILNQMPLDKAQGKKKK